MVALNTAYAAPKNAADPKNRVGDFFYEDRASVGKNRWASRLNAQEKSCYHYETASGRSNWPNRDPIEEDGGLNLFAMVNNDPVNYMDYLGLATKCCKDCSGGNGVPYDTSKECCINGSVTNKSETVTVQICIRKAQVLGGSIGKNLGLFHMWVKTPTCEVGLGDLNVNVPGQGGSKAESPFNETSVNNHSGESTQSGSFCESVTVKACCIKKATQQGPTGNSCASENCNAWTKRIITSCGGDYNRAVDILKQRAARASDPGDGYNPHSGAPLGP